jgi:hypothetical protein
LEPKSNDPRLRRSPPLLKWIGLVAYRLRGRTAQLFPM